jgi:hypothetical protein
MPLRDCFDSVNHIQQNQNVEIALYPNQPDPYKKHRVLHYGPTKDVLIWISDGTSKGAQDFPI